MRSNVQPEECQTAINLTEYWRRDNNGGDIKPGGMYNCDPQVMTPRQWFRFTGDAGNMMLDSCPPPNSCGTRGGLWTNEEMPSTVGVAAARQAFGSWESNCKTFYFPILVIRCSYDTPYDFIYKLNVPIGFCPYSFCGM